MKKVLFLVILLFAFIIGNKNSYSGLEAPAQNILDISNLEVISFNGYDKIHTKEKISILSGNTYTLICSSDILGHVMDEDEHMTLDVSYYNGATLVSQEHIQGVPTYFNSYPTVYYELHSTGTLLSIDFLKAALVNGTDISLIKGSFSDFGGYSIYIEPERYKKEISFKVDIDHLPSFNTLRYIVGGTRVDNVGALAINLYGSTYNPETATLGNYKIILEADTFKVKQYYVMNIQVVDLTAPVITSSQPGPISVDFNNKISVDEIKSYLSVSDNIDTLTSSDIVCNSTQYDNATAPGLVNVVFQATDLSGNVGQLAVEVQLVDTVRPVLVGPSQIYIYMTDPVLTNQYILSRFSATDNVSSPENIRIELYTNEYNQTRSLGNYRIVIRAYDEANNYIGVALYIMVLDNRGGTFTDSGLKLKLNSNNVYTETKLLQYYQGETLSLGRTIYDPYIVYNGYEGHENEDGEYYVYIGYTENGVLCEDKILIEVVNDVSDSSNIVLYSIIAGSCVVVGFAGIIIRKKIKKRTH
jgi:hypothetical protein